MTYPSGVAINAAGEIHVVDSGNHRVQVFEPDGSLIRDFPLDRPCGELFTEPVEGIAIDAEGRVYIPSYCDSQIQVFSPSGERIAELSEYGYGEGEIVEAIGLAVGQSDRLYVADTWRNRVQVLELDGRFVQQWASNGITDGLFDGPMGIATADDGRVYVADESARIQIFESDGTFVHSFGGWGTEGGQFGSIGGMVIDDNGRLLVTDSHGESDINRIQVFDANGTFIKSWGTQGSGEGQFIYPRGIASGPDGLLYVVDEHNRRVQVLDADGQFVRAFGSEDPGDGQFEYAYGIALDDNGKVYVSDLDNSIKVFDNEGRFLHAFGEWGTEPGDLRYPAGITIDKQGEHLYVADAGNHRIQVFDLDGQFVREFGEHGNGSGQFSSPWGLALNAQGELYVADTQNHRVQKFSRGPVLPERLDKAILVAGAGPVLGGVDNPIWDPTETLAHRAYRALAAQGIIKSQGQIRYLTAGGTDQDLDSNGQLDDLLPASPEVLRESLTGWAADADDLILYLIGHGKQGAFLLSAEPDYQWLEAETLAGWLATLQTQLTGEIIVVLDACHAGSFVDRLAGDGRVVLASSSATERARILRDGTSFSRYFWGRVDAGSDLRAAFETARNGIADLAQTAYAQTPQADADGDGAATAFDLEALALRCLGACIPYGSEVPPRVNNPLASQVGASLTRLLLQVEAQSGAAPVREVTAKILPPDQFFVDDPVTGLPSPVTGLPEVPLAYNAATGLYEGVYDAFEELGDYLISFRAQDQDFTLSLPETRILTQNQPPNDCSAQAEGWVQMAYVGYYGRPADPAGLDYWACRMDDEGGQLASIIEAFGTSNEYDQRFGGFDEATLINNLYQNLFNRDADQAGLDWYLAQLDSGQMSLQGIALNVLNGALNLDEAIIANKLEVADHFTRQVRGGCGYGDANIEAAVGLLGAVDAYQFAVAQGEARVDDFCGQ